MISAIIASVIFIGLCIVGYKYFKKKTAEKRKEVTSRDIMFPRKDEE